VIVYTDFYKQTNMFIFHFLFATLFAERSSPSHRNQREAKVGNGGEYELIERIYEDAACTIPKISRDEPLEFTISFDYPGTSEYNGDLSYKCEDGEIGLLASYFFREADEWEGTEEGYEPNMAWIKDACVGPLGGGEYQKTTWNPEVCDPWGTCDDSGATSADGYTCGSYDWSECFSEDDSFAKDNCCICGAGNRAGTNSVEASGGRAGAKTLALSTTNSNTPKSITMIVNGFAFIGALNVLYYMYTIVNCKDSAYANIDGAAEEC